MADYYEEESRGGAFGLLFGVSSLGARPHPQAFQGYRHRVLSLVADYEEEARGGAFGLLFGVSSLGARPHPQAI